MQELSQSLTLPISQSASSPPAPLEAAVTLSLQPLLPLGPGAAKCQPAAPAEEDSCPSFAAPTPPAPPSSPDAATQDLAHASAGGLTTPSSVHESFMVGQQLTATSELRICDPSAQLQRDTSSGGSSATTCKQALLSNARSSQQADPHSEHAAAATHHSSSHAHAAWSPGSSSSHAPAAAVGSKPWDAAWADEWAIPGQQPCKMAPGTDDDTPKATVGLHRSWSFMLDDYEPLYPAASCSVSDRHSSGSLSDTLPGLPPGLIAAPSLPAAAAAAKLRLPTHCPNSTLAAVLQALQL